MKTSEPDSCLRGMRRVRDSNPGRVSALTRFPVVRLRPLSQLCTLLCGSLTALPIIIDEPEAVKGGTAGRGNFRPACAGASSPLHPARGAVAAAAGAGASAFPAAQDAPHGKPGRQDDQRRQNPVQRFHAPRLLTQRARRSGGRAARRSRRCRTATARRLPPRPCPSHGGSRRWPPRTAYTAG